MQVKREMLAEPIVSSSLSNGVWLMETSQPWQEWGSLSLVLTFLSSYVYLLVVLNTLQDRNRLTIYLIIIKFSTYDMPSEAFSGIFFVTITPIIQYLDCSPEEMAHRELQQ